MFHQHFNTPQGGGAIRSYYLATALVEHGHRVTMITSCADRNKSVRIIDGVNVVYLPIPYDNRFSFYARSWSFIRFVVSAIRAARDYKHFEMCYGISAPLTVGICTRWMKFRYGIPYLFEVGDLWPDAPIQLGFVRNGLFRRMLFWLEKSIYRHAKIVVALSEPIRQAIRAKSPTSRVTVVPNMADCKFYSPEVKDPAIEGKYHVSEKHVVSYIGALGVANGLHQLIECARECQLAKLPVHFIICGDGAMLEELKSRVALQALSNVSFVGFLNRDGVKEVMNITDGVFISYLPVPILETGCPNKYFDGLASGKLIIVNFGGWIQQEIETTRCGFHVDPSQPRQLVDRIIPFLSDHSLLEEYQQRSRLLAESRYSRKQLSETFAGLFATS